MKKKYLSALIYALLPLTLVAQKPVIIDADLDSDVDDAGTLAMVYHMHKKGIIDLLGVIITSDDPYAASCASAFNHFYNLGHLPIGFLKGQQKLVYHSRYAKQIAEEFPHKLPSHNDAESSTEVYRRLLAQSEDNSVIILTVGHLSSLQRLLESAPDHNSELTGTQLVEKKVDKWLCMGGEFPEGIEANFSRPDPASTVYCLPNWNKEVVFCGWEIGQPIITGDIAMKAKLPVHHPMYRSYELYNNFKGRSSWDQVATFLLTDRVDEYFIIDNNGYCEIKEDGSNRWIEGKKGKQSIVRFKPDVNIPQLAKEITDYMLGEF